MSIDDQIKRLTKNEITVLFYKCKGLKYQQIATRLTYSVDWVQLQMGGVYTKLGFSKEMHWTKRKEILENEVCPRLPKNIDNWEPVKTITEGTREESKVEPVPDPQMMALVLFDEMEIEKEKSKVLTPPKPKEIKVIERKEENKWIKFFRRLFFALIAAAIISVLGIVVYNFGRNSVSPTPPEVMIITATLPPATDTPIVSATSPIPTDSPVPRNTPIPTDTLAPPTPEFYNQGEWAPIKDGVYAKLNDAFGGGGNCIPPSNGFSLTIDLTNNGGGQYLLRFDPQAFHAVDDTGKEYTLLGAGNDNCFDVGIQNKSYGGIAWIRMKFEGTIPLEAHYLIITADSINGVKLIFHKLL